MQNTCLFISKTCRNCKPNEKQRSHSHKIHLHQYFLIVFTGYVWVWSTENARIVRKVAEMLINLCSFLHLPIYFNKVRLSATLYNFFHVPDLGECRSRSRLQCKVNNFFSALAWFSFACSFFQSFGYFSFGRTRNSKYCLCSQVELGNTLTIVLHSNEQRVETALSILL